MAVLYFSCRFFSVFCFLFICSLYIFVLLPLLLSSRHFRCLHRHHRRINSLLCIVIARFLCSNTQDKANGREREPPFKSILLAPNTAAIFSVSGYTVSASILGRTASIRPCFRGCYSFAFLFSHSFSEVFFICAKFSDGTLYNSPCDCIPIHIRVFVPIFLYRSISGILPACAFALCPLVLRLFISPSPLDFCRVTIK